MVCDSTAAGSISGLIEFTTERGKLKILITQAAKNGWDGVIHELLLLDSRKRKSNRDDEERSVHEGKSQNANDGAGPGARDENDHWLSDALVEASKFGSTAVIRLLAPYANLHNRKGRHKYTALHRAALGKCSHLCTPLLKSVLMS